MASEGMVQELERLRKLLDVNPADQLRKDGSGITTGSDSAYAGALNAAEVRAVSNCHAKACLFSLTSFPRLLCHAGYRRTPEWRNGVGRR